MAVFCSLLISCFPVVLLRYCLSDSEMVPVSSFATGIKFALKFYMHWNSVIKSLYFKILSAPCLIKFLSPESATSININVLFLFSHIMMAGLILGRVLSVRTCWFHNLVTLTLPVVSTDFGTYSYQCSISNFAPLSLHTLKCSWALSLSCLFILFFCQYWACCYDLFRCFIKLFIEFAFAICFCL